MKQPVFTLRFRRQENHARLRKVAGLLGVSMNEVAEAAIEHELDFLSADIADELSETVRLLGDWSYGDEEIDADARSFADGEASERDPLRASMVSVDAVVGVTDVSRLFSGLSMIPHTEPNQETVLRADPLER